MSTAVAENLFETEFDASGFAPEDFDKKGGGSVNGEGFFHVQFQEPVQERKEGKIPVIRIDAHIFAGTDEKQVGKIHFHRFYMGTKEKDAAGKETGKILPLSEGSMLNIFKFFANLGLISKEDVAGSAKVRLPWERLEHFQAIIEIKNEPYPDKNDPTGKKMIDSFKIPYGCNVWQVGDERMARVPKDPDALADFTGGSGVDDVSDI